MSEPKLEISIRTSASGRERKLLLNKRVVSVGAQLSNDIVLNGPGIADQHCFFEILDDPSVIIFHEKQGKVAGDQDSSASDGDTFEFGESFFIGKTKLKINRLDELPQPVQEDAEVAEDAEDEQDPIVVITEDGDRAEHEDAEIVLEDTPVQEDTSARDVSSKRDQYAYITADGDSEKSASPEALRSKKRRKTQSSSSKLPIFLIFVGIVAVGLILGILGFQYMSAPSGQVTPLEEPVQEQKNWKTNTVPMDGTAGSTTSNATLRGQIRSILLESGFEVSEINLTSVPYFVEAYTDASSNISATRGRIDTKVTQNIIFRLYADDIMRPSIEAILSTVDGEIEISDLSYGKLQLNGVVREEKSIPRIRNILLEDIPFLREVNVSGIIVRSDGEAAEFKPFAEQVVGVWLGNYPTLRMKNGRRYSVGDVLPDGRTIVRITRDEVVLMQDANLEIIALRNR